ncbi:29230_t:CDS:2, partial [Racocetra persica]
SKNIKLYAVKEHAKSKDHINSSKKKEIVTASSGHIISLMKIVYCIAQNDIPLKKFNQMTRLSQLLLSIATSIELCLATAISIIVYESTDIATESHIVVYVRYIFDGIIKIQFLSLLQLETNDSKSIYNIIISPFISK